MVKIADLFYVAKFTSLTSSLHLCNPCVYRVYFVFIKCIYVKHFVLPIHDRPTTLLQQISNAGRRMNQRDCPMKVSTTVNFVVTFLSLAVVSLGFIPGPARWMINHPLKRLQQCQVTRPFFIVKSSVDDIFGDEEEVEILTNEEIADDGNKFGFSMDETTGILEATGSETLEDNFGLDSLTEYAKYKDELTAEPETLYPAFALLYKLKPEYMSKTFSVATADHKNYCKEFERLLNDEIISMPKHKGVVMLFVGLKSDDKEETLAEVNKFVDKDPLVTLGIVENWNILDLDPSNKEEVNISVIDGKEGME